MASGVSQSNLPEPLHPNSVSPNFGAVDSNYFSRCGLYGRFTCSAPPPLIMEQSADGQWVVDDWDQRRCVAINVGSINQINEDFVLKAVEKFIDTLPTGVVEVTISAAGSLVLTNPPRSPSRTPILGLRYIRRVPNSLSKWRRLVARSSPNVAGLGSKSIWSLTLRNRAKRRRSCSNTT